MKRKNNKKKLPKFALGAIPADIGYLRPRLLGNPAFSTLQGIYNPLSEADAIGSGRLPYTISKGIQAASPIALAMQNTSPITSITGSNAINSIGGISSAISKGAIPTVGGALNEGGLPTEIGLKAAEGSNFGKAVNAAGKAAAIAGIAYSGANLINDFAIAGDSPITANDMRNSLNTNTITTAGGNQYTTKSGLDTAAINELGRLDKIQKRIGVTADAAGLLGSAGSLLGASLGLGSWGGPIGIGAGLLAGLGLSALGFGDNSDEIAHNQQLILDSIAMSNRQNKSIGEDLDVKDAFYNRTGTVKAANGKRPVWTPAGLVGKRATARVSNGEVIGNFADGLVTRVAGKKNNKDTKLAALKDNDFVISNKYGLSDYAAATGDYAGALNLLEMIMGMRNSKGYKNGKLPKYALGTDMLISLAPHLASFTNNSNLLYKAKESKVYAPDIYVDNPEGTRAVNELAQLRFNADPYYKEAQKGLNWANYDSRRNVVLGPGGRSITEATNYNNYLRGLADITKYANEALNNYAEKYAAALANIGATNQGRRMEAAAKRHEWMQLAMGARENWMAQYRKNLDMNLLNAASEYMRQGLYADTKNINKEMLKLYKQQANLEQLKYLDSLKNKVSPTTPLDFMKGFDFARYLPYILV